MPQIFLPNFFIRKNTIYSARLRTNLRCHYRHEFANAMFNKKGKRILLQTAILIPTKFISGIYMSDIICCIKVRQALVMFLAY